MYFSTIFLNVLLPILTGVLASYAVWLYTFRYLVPKIRFSPQISKISTEENNSNWKYRFKFENYGERNMIDITVIVRLQIQGLKKNLTKNWQNIYIKSTGNNYKNIAIIRPLRKKGRRIVVEIKTYECDFFQKNLFSEEIRSAATNKSLTLEDVLKLGRKANLQIMLLGYDEFSGTRKLFQSKIYTVEDIAEGYFDTRSLKIKPNSNEVN